MTRRILPLLAIALFFIPATATCYVWNESFGGRFYDTAKAVERTRDGGYVVAGYSTSFGESRSLVFRTDAVGNLRWQKGIRGDSVISSIRATTDGGFVATGSTNGPDYHDLWVFKMDSAGNVRWQKRYKSKPHSINQGGDIQQTRDGGYIVAGVTTFFDSYGFWLLKLDAAGNAQWQKAYGEKGAYAVAVQQTSDSGYLVAGYSPGFSGHGNGFDFWVLKLDSSGGIRWQKTYGGKGNDILRSARVTRDGGLVLAGDSTSFGAGRYVACLVKLDANGNIRWQRIYGKSAEVDVGSIEQTADGGYIAAGGATSSSASGNAWVFKVDADGIPEWNRIYGLPGRTSYAVSAKQTNDGGYVIAGMFAPAVSRQPNAWLLKVDATGDAGTDCGLSTHIDMQALPAYGRVASTNGRVAATPVKVASEPALVRDVRASISRVCSPRLASIVPSSVQPGGSVVLSGAGFGLLRQAARVAVGFSGNWQFAKVLSWSDTAIKVQVPATANTGPVNVLTNGASSLVGNSKELVVLPIPPAQLRPDSGPRVGGTRVAILAPKGTVADGLSVYFGGVRAGGVRLVSPTVIVCTSPRAKQPGSVAVSVNSNGRGTAVGSFLYR